MVCCRGSINCKKHLLWFGECNCSEFNLPGVGAATGQGNTQSAARFVRLRTKQRTFILKNPCTLQHSLFIYSLFTGLLDNTYFVEF